MAPKVLTHKQDCGNFILFKVWALKSPNLSFDKLVHLWKDNLLVDRQIICQFVKRTHYLSNDKLFVERQISWTWCMSIEILHVHWHRCFGVSRSMSINLPYVDRDTAKHVCQFTYSISIDIQYLDRIHVMYVDRHTVSRSIYGMFIDIQYDIQHTWCTYYMSLEILYVDRLLRLTA